MSWNFLKISKFQFFLNFFDWTKWVGKKGKILQVEDEGKRFFQNIKEENTNPEVNQKINKKQRGNDGFRNSIRISPSKKGNN
jgi:hypothetical protein